VIVLREGNGRITTYSYVWVAGYGMNAVSSSSVTVTRNVKRIEIIGQTAALTTAILYTWIKPLPTTDGIDSLSLSNPQFPISRKEPSGRYGS
jgi:hypothetical protein